MSQWKNTGWMSRMQKSNFNLLNSLIAWHKIGNIYIRLGNYFLNKPGKTRQCEKKLTPSKTGKFAMWKFLASQTDNKWQLNHFFYSHDYLSWPLYDPDNLWWRHFWQPWRPMVKTHWQPRWLVVKTLWWPLLQLMTTCDYPVWCHWWPMWWLDDLNELKILVIFPMIGTRWWKGWQGDNKDDSRP